MENRIYGVIGISAIMSNWNADFSKNPKTTANGDIFGSDKALKYIMKKFWEENNKKVLYIKSFKLNEKKDAIVPRTLKERYEYLFAEEDLAKLKDMEKLLKNLFSTSDVKQFGATFAEPQKNISIVGAVQIGQGFNRYKDSNIEEQTILSPFKNPNKKPAKDAKDTEDLKDSTKDEILNSSIGSQVYCDEAHYFYPFVINPNVYKNYEELGVTEGYTEEDFLDFKEVALKSVNAYATNAKSGCSNEFAMFVRTKKNHYLPNLSEYISFDKKDGKNVISIAGKSFLNNENIESIEVYFNQETTVIDTEVENIDFYSIL